MISPITMNFWGENAIDQLQSALNTWNQKYNSIFDILTTSPTEFQGEEFGIRFPLLSKLFKEQELRSSFCSFYMDCLSNLLPIKISEETLKGLFFLCLEFQSQDFLFSIRQTYSQK